MSSSHRIGTVCYATQQGIGHLPKWFYDAGVITDVMVFQHSSRPSLTKQWYGPDTSELSGRPFNGPMVDAFLKNIDTMLFFETPFDWTFLEYCKQRGVRTVIVPMYEWWPKKPLYWPSKIICPSLLDQQYFPTAPYLPIPVPPGVRWHPREKATRFLHNAGNLGFRGHKGTLEILQAMQYVQSPISLTIRAQDTKALEIALCKVPGIRGDSRVKIVPGEIDYSNLFSPAFDVFLMAEKYNGLSLPLAEARAAGMLVITSNRFPMNTWLPEAPLIPVSRYTKACVGSSYLEYDEAVIDPKDIAKTVDAIYGTDITEYSYSGLKWAQDTSWGRLRDLWINEILN